MNCLLAVLATLSLAGFRVLQGQISITQSPKSPPDTYRREMKAEVSQEQRQILAYKQEIQQLEEKLEDYRRLNTALPSSPTPSHPVIPYQPPSGAVQSSAPSQPPRNSAELSPRSSSQAESLNQAQTMSFANDLVYGLTVAAHDKRQITRGSRQYREVQTAIKLLRQGKSLEEAAKQAKLPVSLLEQLREWGEIRPGGSQQPLPSLVSHSAQTEEDPHIRSIVQANDVAYGLTIAHQKGQITRGNHQYRKVQTAIKLLRRGKSLEEAAQKSQVSLADLEELIEWGKQRPARRLG